MRHSPTTRDLAVVAAGAALGGGLRQALAVISPEHIDHWSILGINVVGCFALALLPAWSRIASNHRASLFVGPGLLGGFTTLSAFAEQSRALLAAGRTTTAAVYVAATVTLCLGAVMLARRVSGPGPRDDAGVREGQA